MILVTLNDTKLQQFTFKYLDALKFNSSFEQITADFFEFRLILKQHVVKNLEMYRTHEPEIGPMFLEVCGALNDLEYTVSDERNIPVDIKTFDPNYKASEVVSKVESLGSTSMITTELDFDSMSMSEVLEYKKMLDAQYSLLLHTFTRRSREAFNKVKSFRDQLQTATAKTEALMEDLNSYTAPELDQFIQNNDFVHLTSLISDYVGKLEDTMSKIVSYTAPG